ncbi:MAG: hypothetical protein IPM42_20350 [Saprospiraceae bacterium]|nr:hypothetical protein [Saprospiraceae bacterium]
MLSLQNGYRITIHETITEIADLWSSLSPPDIFFTPQFLQCLENFKATGITPYYVILYRHNIPFGIFYFQQKHIRLGESLRIDHNLNKGFFTNTVNRVKKAVANMLNLNTLVCGNMLLTGKYGFHISDEIDDTTKSSLLSNVCDMLQIHLDSKGIGKGLTLIKDFYNQTLNDHFEVKGFTRFNVQPNMIIQIRDHWNNMDDYLEDMKSKYRIRVRRATKKCAVIEKKELDVYEIQQWSDSINALYKNVSDEAGFNLFVLHPHYFEGLKTALGDQLIFTAYFSEGKMVGFYTAIKNYATLDAHFLGYDIEVNRSCQIYLNMLYDLIDLGIRFRVSKVVMSRTALEIKSSVGATPHDMTLFLKHDSSIINALVPPILKFLTPDEKWLSRSPFREN